jgi:alpha-glucoside transport system substrate-binding protein
MADLPAGTVTFLFTDIEGSTQLLKQLRTRYDDVVADHHRILRRSFEEHHGREVDTQGDSFFVAFARAGDAVASAIAGQRALAAHTWPEDVRVPVRMGLHSGEPRAAGERYIGFGVHRAARIAAAGHGGQILVSNATRELVEDELPPGTRLRDLGAYELKDVDRPERLFQLETEGLRHDFPQANARRVRTPRGRQRAAVVATIAAALVVAAGVTAFYWTKPSQPSVGSSRNPITVLSPWEGSEETAFLRVLKAFMKETGLTTQVEEAPNFLATLRRRISADNPPMIAMVPTSGMLADLAREGVLQSLADVGIPNSELSRNYSSVWIDHGTVDGTTYAFPAKATSKSLIWYRPDTFEALGLAVPTTWAQLRSVTAKIDAEGEKPWALGAQDVWTLTDWFENIYIRTYGPAAYNDLFAGELGFDHPSVIAVLEQMSTLLNDRYVAGGLAGSLETEFGEGIALVFGADPDAHLYMEGGFVGSLALEHLKPKPRPGETIAVAPFPAINPTVGSPLVGGSNLAAAFVDNGGVRRLLEYLSSPRAATVWIATGAAVSPNSGVPLNAYPNILVRAEAEQLTDATAFVSDGSDLLPGTLGDDFGSTLQRALIRPADAARFMRAFARKAARVFNG